MKGTWEYPRESHDLSRSGQPRHRLERLRHITAWFRQYLAPGGDKAAWQAAGAGRAAAPAGE